MKGGRQPPPPQNERRPLIRLWHVLGLGMLLMAYVLSRPANDPTPPQVDVSIVKQKSTLTTIVPDEAVSAPVLAVNVAPRHAFVPSEAESTTSIELTSSSRMRRESHPIDSQRERIYRENNFSVALMGAMNVGDYLGLRALIEEYRQAYPEDEHQLQEGYTLVADCLERLTAERQTEARAYWRNNRASIVRRFIRRHCLEKPVVDG